MPIPQGMPRSAVVSPAPARFYAIRAMSVVTLATALLTYSATQAPHEVRGNTTTEYQAPPLNTAQGVVPAKTVFAARIDQPHPTSTAHNVRSDASATSVTLRTDDNPDQAITVTGTVQRYFRESHIRTATSEPGDRGTVVVVATDYGHLATSSPEITTLASGTPVDLDLAPADSDKTRDIQAVHVRTTADSLGWNLAPANSFEVNSAEPVPMNHKVTIVLALPPGTTRDGHTPTTMRNLVAESSQYWSQQTNGIVSFSTEKAVDWLPISSPCQNTIPAFTSMIDEIAQKVNFTFGEKGKHLVVYIPSKNCPYGLGTVGVNIHDGGVLSFNSTQDIYGQQTADVLSHELGHNLGLSHSSQLDCGAVADGNLSQATSCIQAGYADIYDVMGFGGTGHIGALNQVHLSRLGVRTSSRISIVSSGKYTLNSVSDSSGVTGLQIKDPVSGVLYHVELRVPSGQDSWLDYEPFANDGVLVRRVAPDENKDSLLIDASPDCRTQNDTGDLAASSALGVGHTFTSYSGGLTLRIESIDNGQATVAVALGSNS